MKKLLKILGTILLIAGGTFAVAGIISVATSRMTPAGVPAGDAAAAGNFLSAFAIVRQGGPGQGMPPVKMLDLDEKPHDINEYKGKVLLVNFWAAWCQPCLAELPALERLRKEKAGRDFDVVYISMDYPENAAALRQSMEKLPVGVFPSFYTKDQTLWQNLGLDALPVTMLLGRDGHVIYTLAGDGPWDSQAAKDFIANLQ
jgi:thiol-disulfide isomerase/thioredoxin